MAIEENGQHGNVKIEIKSGQFAKVMALVQNNAISRITEVTYQNENTLSNVQAIGLIKPDMVIDFHIGNHTSLSLDNDPRFLIEDNPNYEHRWSLGDGGWIIFGFSNGFEAIRENVIQFVELAVGEWVDLWVAQTINNKLPVIYQDNNVYSNYINPNNNEPFYKSVINQQRYQAGEGLSNIDEIRRIINPNQPDQPGPDRPGWIPEGWRYVGAVKGSGRNTINGPNLGIILEHFPGNYYYLLVHDVGGYPGVIPPWGGADLGEIGVYITHATAEMYFLLVIDDSASPTEKKKDKYQTAVEYQIQSWKSIQGQNQHIEKYLGVRMIRWPKDTPPPGWCNNREFNAENYSTNNLNQNELTERLRFNYSINGNSLENQIWIPFSRVDEAIINAIKEEIRLNRLHTPLVEAFGDIVNHDFKDKNGQNIPRNASGQLMYSFTIKIISDGIPDPCNKFSRENMNNEANVNAIKNFIGSMELEEIPAYSVRQRLIDLKNCIRRQNIDLIGDFPVDSSGNTVHWVIDEYRRLRDENGQPLLSITSLEGVITGSVEGQRPDHNTTYHTDCLNGNQSHCGRIGQNEAKRVIMDGDTPLPLPVSWIQNQGCENGEIEYNNKVIH